MKQKTSKQNAKLKVVDQNQQNKENVNLHSTMPKKKKKPFLKKGEDFNALSFLG